MDSSNKHLTFSNLSVKEVGKAVEEHKDDKRYGSKGVYILECDKRSFKKTKRFGMNVGSTNTIPKWVWPAHSADKRLYIGSSKRVGYRILQHIHNDGAWFTEIFPPKKIQGIEWYARTQDNLQEIEKEKAVELREDNIFVYQN